VANLVAKYTCICPSAYKVIHVILSPGLWVQANFEINALISLAVSTGCLDVWPCMNAVGNTEPHATHVGNDEEFQWSL
jgi:hypothetical protein